MSSPLSIVSSGIEIRATTDIPLLCYIIVEELDGSLIKIPITNLQLTVEELFASYRQMSSFKGQNKEQIFFRIQQGMLQSFIALKCCQISSLGLDLTRTCFKAIKLDSGVQESIKNTQEIMVELEKPRDINLQFILDASSFQIPINIDKKVIDLKKIISTRQGLKVDMIRLQTQFNVLSDSNKISYYKEIIKDRKVRALIHQNYFILLPNNRQKKIRQMRNGDQILGYSIKNNDTYQHQVLEVHESYSLQKIVIILEDNSKIEATSNHMFLCNDNRFRRYRPKNKRHSLNIGMFLKKFDGSEIAIKEIIYDMLDSQAFYLFVQKDTNYIMNGLVVCHQQCLFIDYEQNNCQIIVTDDEEVHSIKQKVQKKFGINHANFLRLLTPQNTQLNNKSSLLDYHLRRNSKLKLKSKKQEDFNYLHPNTRIKIQGNNLKEIKNIQFGDIIINYNIKNGEENGQIIDSGAFSKIVFQYYTVTLETKQEISLAGGSFLELSNGALKFVQTLHQSFQANLDTVMSLRKNSGDIVKIDQIKKIKQDRGMLFYGIHSKNIHSYITQHNLRIYNETIAINLNLKGKEQQISLPLSSSTRFKISEIIQAKSDEVFLFYRSNELKDQQIINIKQINCSSLVTAFNKMPQSQKQFRKFVKVQLLEGEIIQLSYDQNKDKTMQEILGCLIPNYRLSYFCIFGQLIILPHEKLNKIENQAFYSGQAGIVRVIKNENISFQALINLSGQKIPYEGSFQYLTLPKQLQAMNQCIKHFSKNVFEKDESTVKVIDMVRMQYLKMKSLPNYVSKQFQETYFGIKNFKLPNAFQKNSTFYLSGFLMTTSDRSQVQEQMKKQSGTLFRLRSTSGKDKIVRSEKSSIFSFFIKNDKPETTSFELVFPPFTYFLINKIERYENLNEVWISQISPPITFKQEIVLWVDDQPQGNKRSIKKFQKKDVQIIQLISTLQAEKWLKQFRWILNLKTINFKIVSDMGRTEYVQNSPDPIFIKNAGFNLVDKVFNKHKLNVKMLIFCGDSQSTQNLLMTNKQFEGIKGLLNQNFRITDSIDGMVNFCSCNE